MNLRKNSSTGNEKKRSKEQSARISEKDKAKPGLQVRKKPPGKAMDLKQKQHTWKYAPVRSRAGVFSFVYIYDLADQAGY